MKKGKASQSKEKEFRRFLLSVDRAIKGMKPKDQERLVFHCSDSKEIERASRERPGLTFQFGRVGA